MAEYIERKAAIEAISKIGKREYGCGNTSNAATIMIAEDALRAIQAADVAPVRHGRWNFYDSFALECSNCGWINYHNMGVPNAFNYCPNCGADTRGEQDV